jgi:hypothetical protein
MRSTKAFSSEAETGSRQENASNQESRAPFRFNRNGALALPIGSEIRCCSTLTADYQLITNPAYNADRGPVSIFSGRLHGEF